MDPNLLQYLNRIEAKLDQVSTELSQIKLKCLENNCVKVTLGAKEWTIIAGIVTVICTTVTGVFSTILK